MLPLPPANDNMKCLRYRILSFGIKLQPPHTWHTTFTLSRLPDQPPIATALAYPMSDQLDDWRDYQRLKTIDRGEDFAVLRDILKGPNDLSTGEDIGGEDMERGDSGYFSRRSSKISTRANSIPDVEAVSGKIDDLADVKADVEFTLVAEGTPASTTPDGDEDPTHIVHTALETTAEEPHHFFDPSKQTSTLDGAGRISDPDLSHTDRVSSGQSQEARSDDLNSETDEADVHEPENRKNWVYEWNIWRTDGESSEDGATGLDGGVEELEFEMWLAEHTRSGSGGVLEVVLEDTVVGGGQRTESGVVGCEIVDANEREEEAAGRGSLIDPAAATAAPADGDE